MWYVLPNTLLLVVREMTNLGLKGTGDNFYKQKQLLPENFIKAAKEAGVDKGIELRMQPDYDHSYFFISTFAEDHVNYAAKYLI